MSKRESSRTTRACPVAEIDGALLSELRSYGERRGVDVDLNASMTCVCTDSTIRTKGWFGRTKVEQTHTFAVLTGYSILVLVLPGAGEALVHSYRLADLEVRDYETTPGHRLVRDTGLEMTGFSPGASVRSTYFLGLGPEQDARAFRETLKAAAGSSPPTGS